MTIECPAERLVKLVDIFRGEWRPILFPPWIYHQKAHSIGKPIRDDPVSSGQNDLECLCAIELVIAFYCAHDQTSGRQLFDDGPFCDLVADPKNDLDAVQVHFG